jgi:hypothetical protein
MLHLISSKPYDCTHNEGFVIAFFSTLFITGIFALLGFAYPTNKIVPVGYYKIKNPKKLNFMNNVIGLQYFKFLIIIVLWG